MAEFSINVRGAKEVNSILNQMPTKLRKLVVIRSLKEGMKLIQKDAKRRAPRGMTGNLRRSISVRNSKIHNGRRGRRELGIFLTIRKRKAGDPRNAYYGKFVEDGYNVRGKAGGSGKRKSQRGIRNLPGRKFIKSAFSRFRRQAVNVSVRSAELATTKLAKRLGL